MLTGKASLYIDTVQSDDDPLPPEDPRMALLAAWEKDRLVAHHHTPRRLDRSKFGKFIISFDAGKSFGEIALMTEDAVRNASIIADDETDLLVIDRHLFNGTLKAKQEADYRERKEFIRKSPLFRGWNAKFRRLLEMSVRKETLPFDSTLVKQGEPVLGLHFIIRGQARVTVDTAAHPTQYPKLYDGSNSTVVKEFGSKYVPQRKKGKQGSQQTQIRVRRREGYAAAERRLAEKYVTLCHVDESEVIGDIELVLGLESYSQTLQCTANTEVFILDNKNIERLIYRKNPSTIELLRNNVEGKLRSRLCMRVGSQVELYTHLLVKCEDLKPRRSTTPVGGKEERPQSAPLPQERENKSVRTMAEATKDRDHMLSQLTRLFLDNKAPFIEPSTHGSVFYKTKAAEHAKRHMLIQRKSSRQTTGEVRLQRARRESKRQPRSRRELERLTIGTDDDDIKQLQDKNHAVNRFLNSGSSSKMRTIPSAATTRPRSSSAATVLGDSRPHLPEVDKVFITETDYPEFPEGDGGQLTLEPRDVSGSEAMQQIVMKMAGEQQSKNSERAEIICAMIERRSNKQPAAVQGLLRPKSAPARHHNGGGVGGGGYYDYDAEPELESFDEETGDEKLSVLEQKLKDFHQQYDSVGKRAKCHVREMRRFNIQSPEDVPIPGGAVFVRHKQCSFPAGNLSSAHHQHVRRFIIPKNAYAIAARSMSSLTNGHQHNDHHEEMNNGMPSNSTKNNGGQSKQGVALPGNRKMRIQSAPNVNTKRLTTTATHTSNAWA